MANKTKQDIKVCNNCKYARHYLRLTALYYYEIHCMLWDMPYSKMGRCGEYQQHRG